MMLRLPFLVALLLSLGCGSQPAGPPSTPSTPATPLASTSLATAAPDALAEFAARAAKLGMVFEAPAGYSAVAVRNNVDMAYGYALVSGDRRIEMRFSLRPYTTQDPEPTRTREFSWGFFQTGILNLTRGGSIGKAAQAQALRGEVFGADEARVVGILFHDTNNQPEYFGSGYRACAAIFLHRDDVGDAYTFVLFKDPAEAENFDEANLHSLRFASRPARSQP